MHKNAMKCKQNKKAIGVKQAWSIKNYRYISDVSGRWADEGRRVVVMSKEDYGVVVLIKAPSPWSGIL
jgi:hypothetical protein